MVLRGTAAEERSKEATRQMNQTEPRAVLWDMDGTMVNSGEYHWLAWQAVMESEGRPITYEEFADTFGQRNDTILRRYFGEDIAASEIQRIAEAKESHYRSLVRSRGIQLLPGVSDWLRSLQQAGWLQAIASAAPRRNIETIIEVLALESYFAALVSAEDVQRGKPDPQVYLLAAERLSVPAPRCIVVEDSPAGITGARRAEMYSIGVRTTHESIEADRVVNTLDELPDDAFDQLLSA